jgi:hypothetical protein
VCTLPVLVQLPETGILGGGFGRGGLLETDVEGLGWVGARLLLVDYTNDISRSALFH